MARKSQKRPGKQVDGAPPVVEDAKLPRMGEGDVAPQRIGRGVRLMPDEPKPDAGKRNRMKPMPRGTGRSARTSQAPFPDQEGPRASHRPAEPDEPEGPGDVAGDSKGYLRLRILVSDGELSLQGITFVEGPLVETEELHPGLAYEVTLGGRRIAIGEIPDAGVWRSYPDPEGRPAMQGHHITEVTSYEIAVRVRVEALSASSLSRMLVTLYRWQAPGPSAPVGPTPLKAQFKGRLREIGTLKGVRLEHLPRATQTAVRRVLR
jgi:hypothetical protein